MDALKDLIFLITRHKRKQLNVIGYDASDDRYELFYDKLERGQLNTDDEAAAYFFGPDKDGNFTQYKNFKNRFFRRLANAAFHLDLKKPEFNDAQLGFYNCWKNLALAKFLGVFGAYSAAKKIMLKTLPAALKFELTEVVLEMSRLLFFHYTAREPKKAKQKYYKELVRKSVEELSITVRAETMHVELIAPFVLNRSSKPWMADEAARSLRELEPYFGKINGYRFNLYFFLIKRLEKEIRYDYPGLIAVSREALAHFEKRNSTPKTTIAIFGNTLLIGLTMMRKYEEAEQVAIRSFSMVQKYSVGWYKTSELYITLLFYKKDYQKAYYVLTDAIGSKRFNFLPPAEQETWKIYKGYIQLFIAAGEITRTDEEKKKDRFRPSRFLNNIPHFSKDKRGMNIPVLIIHAIYLLFEKRYDEAYDRMLALEKYNYRHLKEGDDTFRTWCFIRSLLEIQKADFEKEASQKKAARYLRRMNSQPVQYLNAPHEVEVIPYEDMWEIAMKAING